MTSHRSGYGTTRGGGEWWPHAPMAVPLIGPADAEIAGARSVAMKLRAGEASP